ncbi:uncharacterized protein LOC129774679 [Toxorhynchites rutilus septentrionalis]|uniref:uncharacterized protein LOC129774679 n=1 Tax=Toxorhynchites rutilus septentrionalis TaxID=329112 RepID=UPI00247A2D40|nr:uncharacterized protein LOC129774679 [Toxorhynchites rutilus septentrionalis]XP_055634494.1 uncharacterized protein LOC129774679 [Toxorhynchites rutilus septentrionalis]XP_055634495.1 uncharacterized protein LOC129774679 [Toxorhynchites rutilus septentrionalis]
MASSDKSTSNGTSESQPSSCGSENSRDEVDFVLKLPSVAESDTCLACSKNQKSSGALNNNCSHGKSPDKFNIFHLKRRPKSDPGTGTIAKHAQQLAADASTDPVKKKKSRFVKSASIARIFGNNYNTKKHEQDGGTLLKLQHFKRSFLGSERFHKKDPTAVTAGVGPEPEPKIGDGCYVNDNESGTKAIRSITRGLGRLLRRNSHSIEISRPDPEYKVSYLGNVLTGWAKGEGCVEKPLATLWRNYTQNSKPDVMMKLCLCPSGLKATTRQHGLTEYWSHRITYCSAPKNYPRVFCWIYRHEGRKLKHEFRCHAVICSKETIAKDISSALKENLAKALLEFKRDKLNRQNARLSLANSVYDNPSMPRRKIMLSVGANNYRPPLERSKSAPKLMAIEEMIGEEEEEDDQLPGGSATKVPKSGQAAGGEDLRACCKEDALYPSTTLGRRRCRRGHSMRRSRLRNSFKSAKAVEAKVPLKNENLVQESPMNKSVDSILDTIKQEEEEEHVPEGGESSSDNLGPRKISHSSDSSEDDFETLLRHYNYNSKEPLSLELISYLDMKLSPKEASSMHDISASNHRDNVAELGMRLEDARLALSLDDLDSYENDHRPEESEDGVFFNQDEVLEMLRSAAESASSFVAGEKADLMSLLQKAPNGEDDTAPPSLLCVSNKISGHSDSDEGSISSGCETSSTVTTNTDESAAAILIKPCSVLERVRSFEQLADHQVIQEPIGEKTPLGKHCAENAVFKRSITVPAPGVKTSFLLPVTTTIVQEASKLHAEPTHPLYDSTSASSTPSGSAQHSLRLKSTVAAINTELINHLQAVDSDSDLSDESGYVEFQDHQPPIKSMSA